jgi:hypothetical protein
MTDQPNMAELFAQAKAAFDALARSGTLLASNGTLPGMRSAPTSSA